MQVVNIDNLTGGISQDNYTGNIYYMQGINARKNQRRAELYQGTTDIDTQTSTDNIYALLDSKLAFGGAGSIYTQSNMQKIYERDTTTQDYVNVEIVKNATAQYGVGILNNTIDTRVYDETDSFGGIITAELSGVVSTFTSGWTVSGTGTGWTVGFLSASHTPGNTETLAPTTPPAVTIGNTYSIKVVIDTLPTAGSCTIAMGGDGLNITTSTTQTTQRKTFVASTTDTLVFTPSSDFDGVFSEIYTYVGNVDEGKEPGGNAVAIESSSYHPTLVYNGTFLFIGAGNKVERINFQNATRIKDTGVTIEETYTIKSILHIGDQVQIFATDGRNSKQYFWDGVTNSVSTIVDWKDLNILNAVNTGSTVYVVCNDGVRSYLYLSLGYQKQLISKSHPLNDTYDGGRKFYFYPDKTNSMKASGDIIYMADLDGRVWSYGQSMPGSGNSFDIVNGTEDGEVQCFNIIDIDKDYITRCIQGTLRKMLVADTGNVISSGYFETAPILGSSYDVEKYLKKIRIGCRLETGSSIKVYTKTEGEVADDSTYTLIETITDTTKNYHIIDGPTVGIKFNELMVKLELIGSTTKSPQYFNMKVYIDENNHD